MIAILATEIHVPGRMWRGLIMQQFPKRRRANVLYAILTVPVMADGSPDIFEAELTAPIIAQPAIRPLAIGLFVGWITTK